MTTAASLARVRAHRGVSSGARPAFHPFRTHADVHAGRTVRPADRAPFARAREGVDGMTPIPTTCTQEHRHVA